MLVLCSRTAPLKLVAVAWLSLAPGCGKPTEVSPADASATGIDGGVGMPDGSTGTGAGSPSDVGNVESMGADLAKPEAGAAGDPRELIGRIIASIDEKEVLQAVTELYQMSIPNRVTGSANYKKATEWARAMVEAKAPITKVKFIEGNGLRNTEIVLKGSDPAAGMYIIGGHLDSVAAGPGADDDGSGSIGTMFLAMALSRYQFKSELRFLLFDAEETGFVGSGAYVRELVMTCAPDTCLKLYVNLDMISNDPRNQARIRVTTTDTALRALHTKINTDHGLGAVLVFGGDACGTSDDCAFQRSGYKTIEIKEDEFSPNWHKSSDTQANQNVATMTKNIKLAAGVAAFLAGVEGTRP
jgi:aminopeptidase S